MSLSTIKNKIKEKLDTLVPATLGEVQVDDLSKDIFDRDISAYPCAFMSSPAIASECLTNRENIRTYSFEIAVLMQREKIASATDVENLIQTILNLFDNDPTLGGTADGAVEPSTSQPAARVSRGETYIVFGIELRVKESILLNF